MIANYSGEPGVQLTYYTPSGSGDAGDQYTGLDRFGRVVDQRWEKSKSNGVASKYLTIATAISPGIRARCCSTAASTTNDSEMWTMFDPKETEMRYQTKVTGATTRHYYYSDRWQVLEERLNAGSTADRHFVWGRRYKDDLILSDQGATRHYVLHDYFNVTALVNTSRTVKERYCYDGFGHPPYIADLIYGCEIS